jgi:hypothetical protein
MSERLARTASIGDLPRFGKIDQQALREMRSESPHEHKTPKPRGQKKQA